MDNQQKIVAAITGAITMYLASEKMEPIAPTQREELFMKPEGMVSPWVLGGRQASMEMRRLLQMRLIK